MELNKLSATKAHQKYLSGEFTAVDLVNQCIATANKYADKNAVIEIFEDALAIASALDEKRSKGEKLGKLAGVTVMIKDNILYAGKKCTSASSFMQNFVSTYTATALQKMLDEDAIVIGRTNMDEFACGGNGINSFYGEISNAVSSDRIAGGSSGGSAVSVALNMCAVSLASDAGGSARKPASYNGVVGVKGSYGLVSRHGVYQYASSFDQVAPIARTVEDCAYVLQIIAGNDGYDMTSTTQTEFDFTSKLGSDIKGKVFGVEKTIANLYKDSVIEDKMNVLINFIKANGGIVKEVEIDNINLVTDIYKIISLSEMSSNFARYDGLKYTTQTKNPANVEELYKKSRKEGFCKEVQKRIMLGNYILSQAGVYQKAKNIQQSIIDSAKKVFESVNCLIMPTAFSVAPLKGELEFDDAIVRALANVLRTPAISLPFGSDSGLPLGVSVYAKGGNEEVMFAVADYLEKNYEGGND